MSSVTDHSGATPIGRRTFVAATLVGVAATASGTTTLSRASTRRPLALVYRGPAAGPGCAESVARLLRDCPVGYRTYFCGPDGDVPLSPATLARAAVFAQPGGGTVAAAWPHLRRHADDIRHFTARGGKYLGFCLGAYLAGWPGYRLLPGNSQRYISTHKADIITPNESVIPIHWQRSLRHMYFQDGPFFRLRHSPGTRVLARYTNGLPAAVVTAYGHGTVGVVGPHPEADASWYGPRLHNPDGIRTDLGYDFLGAASRHRLALR